MSWPPSDVDHLLVSAAQMAALEEEMFASGLPIAALMEKVGQAMAAWFRQQPGLLANGVVV
ncbi:MAG TPA: bifunctional ADP-dependent NAD(P)H-hydrate dehydratase/NAD(P)H-hydrate epimerase, partial [Prochlorococcaceae cyanobacterium Fu_MAG_72]|nr:bifunctional ADP-dependent NAD(P)H-hydrate dehydratase/NAD(P)H-hydrate epimerase [Prochlorococcaceae cyanobacterium Fu_MAG_72]